MSFTDFEINDFIGREQRSATTALADAQEVSPDDAVRARQLADATGADPTLVLGDLKGFEQQHKLSLGTQIVSENEFIKSYLNGNPLAAKVSSDDLGQLDTVSEKLRKFNRDTESSLSGRMFKGFTEGLDAEIGFQEYGKLFNLVKENPLIWANPATQALVGAGMGLDLAMRVGRAGIYAGAELVKHSVAKLGMDEADADRLIRDLVVMSQVAIPEASTGLGMKGPGGLPRAGMRSSAAEVEGFLGTAEGIKGRQEINAFTAAMDLGESVQKQLPSPEMFANGEALAPWLRAGKEPPVGLHPLTDNIKKAELLDDEKALFEAVTEAAKSATRERSPDLFADFIREHTDGEIFVGVDAVRALYGDKPPSPDDNILGWVPRISEQLALAEATGGDIAIPIADLMAHGDPAVLKELKDHIRYREGGMTKEETKAPEIEVYHGSPADFEAFNSQHMGSGEGAQAYGYGHYLAENQAVADEYRRNVTHSRFLDKVQELYDETSDPIEAAASIKESGDFTKGEKNLLAALEKDDWLGFDFPHQAVRAALKNPENFEMSPETQVALKEFGNLYKAKIKRAPEEFLDWDKPLSEQPQVLSRLVDKEELANWAGTGNRGVKHTFATHDEAIGQLTGEDYWTAIAGDKMAGGDKIASQRLSEAGIAGIRYVDQFSRKADTEDIVYFRDAIAELQEDIVKSQEEADRTTGSAHRQGMLERVEKAKADIAHYQRLLDSQKKPTSNYVVFSDADIEITHRNDTPIGRAVEGMRKAAGFKPEQGGRKATIQRESGFEGGKTQGFAVLDERGNKVADLFLAEEDGGKRLYVDDIAAVDSETGRPMRIEEAANTLGPKAMRDILEQIKEQFPNAETLEGMRVSGAREKASTEQGFENRKGSSKASIDLTKIKPRKKPQQLELPQDGTTRIEDRDAFEKGAAIGMTVDQYKRYQKLIEKQSAEDQAYYTKKAVEEAKRKQTAEWKANEAAIRQEVAAEFRQRPDILADEFFRDGRLYDQPLGEKPKLAVDALTEEQKAALPKDYYSKKGMNPDDAAILLGFSDGAQLIASVAQFNADRAASGMRPIDYSRRLVSAETERRMEARYGSLTENIIEEAKERVLSETQIDMLHEEALARATEAGLEFSIKKDEFVGAIRERFEQATFKEVSSDKFFADAARANKAAEMALLKGDYAEAFRQKQRAYIASVMAKEAIGIESLKEKLDKTADRFGKREVKGIEQETANYIQGLLTQAGYPSKLTPNEIAAAIAFQGQGTLRDYVATRADMGWDPAVSEALQDAGAKPIEQMTVEEFREFKDAIDSLVHIGREENKITIAGEKAEFDAFKKEVIDNLKELPLRPRNKQGNWFYKFDASLTRMEELVKDLDLREELGPLYRAVIEPLMASKAKEFDLVTELANHFKAVKGEYGRKFRKSLNDVIPNDFLIDPHSRALYDLKRENLINIALNWGNASNIEKISRGQASLELGRRATKEEGAIYALRMKQLLDQHMRKEDWAFVGEMWSPFKKWQKMSDTVSRNTSGVAPKWIESQPIQTPFGEIEGGYWPVKYDRMGSDLSVIEDKKPNSNALFGPDFYRAATSKGNLKERTGYIDAVDIVSSIEQAAGVMQQTMHDIAFRDSLMQAGKVFYDKDIRRAIRAHYGEEYEAQLIPWLKRIANKNTANDPALRAITDFLKRMRVNLIGHALPLNLKVILSPDIGMPDPRIWTSFEANRGEASKLAMEKSNEIRHLVYNMDRDYREQLERLTTHKAFLSEVQRKAVEFGFKPMMKVSQEFRMATFYHQYNEAKGRGLSDHEAAVVADSFVRERHGAASVVDLPAIMESGEAMKSLTMFYGYFNTMYNWQRQIPGNARRREYGKMFENTLGSVIVGAAFGAALFNDSKENDSWFKIIAKALALQPLQTIAFVRDAANYFFEGQRPSGPIGALLSAAGGAATEGMRYFKDQPMKKPIKTAANVIGMTTGLPLLQVGRSGQFLMDVATGKQRPKNYIEYIRGFVHGESQLKRGK